MQNLMFNNPMYEQPSLRLVPLHQPFKKIQIQIHLDETISRNAPNCGSLNGMVIPHAQSVALAAMGALQPKAKHAAGGFIDPASMVFPLQQNGRSGNSRSVNIGAVNVSSDISRQAFLESLRRVVQ